MDKNIDLTSALVKLIEGQGREAAELAARWPNQWVARCIIYLANSFFLYDPVTATEPFGGMEGINKLMESECVERYFLRGHSARFRKEPDVALSAFQSAAKLEPNNPFVEFSLVLMYAEQSSFGKLNKAISEFGQKHPNHPLLYAINDMFEEQD